MKLQLEEEKIEELQNLGYLPTTFGRVKVLMSILAIFFGGLYILLLAVYTIYHSPLIFALQVISMQLSFFIGTVRFILGSYFI